ncbi:MAG: hypothetical protein Q9187_001480, partial [Circinaria calcarea]
MRHGTDLVAAGGLWIARGNGLKISLHIKLDGIGMDESELRDLIEDMGSFLKNAEIWSQLYLQPSLSVLSRKIDDPDSSATLILSLKHGPQPFWNSKFATKARTLIVSDTRPPADIPCAGLEEVRINLIFSRTSQNVYKRIKHKTADYTGEIPDNDVMLLEGNGLCSADLPHHSQPTRSLLQDVPNNLEYRMLPSQSFLKSSKETLDRKHSINISVHDDPLYSDGYQSQQILSPQPASALYAWEPRSQPPQVSENDYEEMLDDDYSDTISNQIPSQDSGYLTGISDDMFFPPELPTEQKSPSNPKKRSSSLSTPTSRALDITAAAKLVDAALRTLIYDTKIRLSPGVKRKEISPGPKLAEISPALFSPGYLH